MAVWLRWLCDRALSCIKVSSIWEERNVICIVLLVRLVKTGGSGGHSEHCDIVISWVWHYDNYDMTSWQFSAPNSTTDSFKTFVICWKKIFWNISENQSFSIFPLNWANNFYLNCKLIVAEQSWHFRRAPVQTCSYFSLEWILFSRLSLSTFSLRSCDTFYWIFQ